MKKIRTYIPLLLLACLGLLAGYAPPDKFILDDFSAASAWKPGRHKGGTFFSTDAACRFQTQNGLGEFFFPVMYANEEKGFYLSFMNSADATPKLLGDRTYLKVELVNDSDVPVTFTPMALGNGMFPEQSAGGERRLAKFVALDVEPASITIPPHATSQTYSFLLRNPAVPEGTLMDGEVHALGFTLRCSNMGDKPSAPVRLLMDNLALTATE